MVWTAVNIWMQEAVWADADGEENHTLWKPQAPISLFIVSPSPLPLVLVKESDCENGRISDQKQNYIIIKSKIGRDSGYHLGAAY